MAVATTTRQAVLGHVQQRRAAPGAVLNSLRYHTVRPSPDTVAAAARTRPRAAAQQLPLVAARAENPLHPSLSALRFEAQSRPLHVFARVGWLVPQRPTEVERGALTVAGAIGVQPHEIRLLR